MVLSLRRFVLLVVWGRVFLHVGPVPEQEQIGPEPVQQSAWGEPVNGLQLRATFPKQTEQGKELTPAVEFRCDVAGLPPNVRALNPCYDMCTYFRLLLTNLETEELVGIDADTRTFGPPGHDDGRFARPLDGSPIEVWPPMFATLIEGTPLPPGRYRAVVRYRQPLEPSPFWRGTREEWDAREFWSGNVESEPLEIEFTGAIERTDTIYVPKRVRVMKRFDWPSLHPPPVPRVARDNWFLVTYLFDDAEAVVVPRRNGHWIGHTAECSKGGLHFTGGAPTTGDWLDQLHEYQYEGGDLDYTLTLTVFETCEQDLSSVGPYSYGYAVLWEKTFPVNYTAAETAAAPELPWYGPP